MEEPLPDRPVTRPADGGQPPAWRRLSAPTVSPQAASASLLGVPFEGTSGGRPLQARAPGLVRQALASSKTATAGEGPAIFDAGDVLAAPVEPEPTLDRIEQALAGIEELCPRALPLVLGGEHTVSLGVARALQPATIVSLDAHPDLWEAQHGREIGQGTWFRRAIEATGCQGVLLGARAARGAERDAIDELGIHQELPASLPEPVHLTIDVDVFDPSDAPSVVFPEPGGPTVDEVLGWIHAVCTRFEVRAVDLVEVNANRPGPTSRLAARAISAAIVADQADRPPSGPSPS